MEVDFVKTVKQLDIVRLPDGATIDSVLDDVGSALVDVFGNVDVVRDLYKVRVLFDVNNFLYVVFDVRGLLGEDEYSHFFVSQLSTGEIGDVDEVVARHVRNLYRVIDSLKSRFDLRFDDSIDLDLGVRDVDEFVPFFELLGADVVRIGSNVFLELKVFDGYGPYLFVGLSGKLASVLSEGVKMFVDVLGSGGS